MSDSPATPTQSMTHARNNNPIIPASGLVPSETPPARHVVTNSYISGDPDTKNVANTNTMSRVTLRHWKSSTRCR